MRKLIWGLVLVAAAWSGWWMLAGWALERGIADWQADRQAAGWSAEMDAGPVRGFPMRLQQELKDIAITEPVAGAAVRVGAVGLSAPTHWPGDVDIKFEDSPIALVLGGRTYELSTTDAVAVLRLHRGVALELESLGAKSGLVTVAEPEGNLFQANALRADLVQEQVPERYRATVAVDALIPGGNMRTALGVPADWPLAFEGFAADAVLGFDKPLDRQSGKDAPPQLRSLEVRAVDLHWGTLRLQARGSVTVDAQGVPEGEISLTFQDWRTALTFAERADILPSGARTPAEFMLNMLAKRGDDPEVLKVTLKMRDGDLSLDGFPLGPAPTLIRR